jgi:death-on-curing protein
VIEPHWLDPETVVELNEVIVGSTGEPFQLRDDGLLEGALGRVYSHWAYGGEADIVSLAVTLIFAITSNHPFAQGNKRTGFEAGILFLRMNGYEWTASDQELFANTMIAVIEDRLELMDFANLFEAFVTPIEAEDDEGDDIFDW